MQASNKIEISHKRKVKRPIRLCVICKISGADMQLTVRMPITSVDHLVHSKCIAGKKNGEILEALGYGPQ